MEYLLKKYRKLNQKERKDFTLVELLVVIAILAVLASVSVVGYLGFTTKAKNSNALTELTQVREVIRANLIDGDEYTYENKTTNNDTTSTVYSAKYQYLNKNYYFTFTCSAIGTYTYKQVLEASFSDLGSLGGTYYLTFGTSKVKDSNEYNNVTEQPTNGVTSETTYTISTIGFKSKDGGYALWTISDDKVETSTESIVSNGKTTCYTKTA